MPSKDEDLDMTDRRKPDPGERAILEFLETRHAHPIEELTALEGGYWSSAWAYRADGEDRVLRLGHSGDGYGIDAQAFALAGAHLPIPEVFERGEALDHHYALSRRHAGVILETRPASQRTATTRLLGELLFALRAVPTDASAPPDWYAVVPDTEAPDAPDWQSWLRRGYADRSVHDGKGWWSRLDRYPDVREVFDACRARIDALLPRCPERRDLVHGDLLHQNVLVAEDLSAVTAVFSWKCSALGDFLYDLAWATHWSPWHPCLDPAALYRHVLQSDLLDDADRENADARHQCYELQIAASHFGWFVWTEDDENLLRLTDNARAILEREGPPAG